MLSADNFPVKCSFAINMCSFHYAFEFLVASFHASLCIFSHYFVLKLLLFFPSFLLFLGVEDLGSCYPNQKILKFHALVFRRCQVV